MASKVSTFVLGHGIHRISCNHSNSSMPFHSLRCVPISCKARDKSFSSQPRRQQAKKLSPDRSLLNITSQQVAEENTKDRNANSSSVSKFLLENKSDADPPMNVGLQLISDVNTDDRDANSNDIAKFHLEAGSNGEIDDHPSISTPDGEDFDDSKFLGETESFLTKYTKDAEQLSNIQLEDLVGMMRNAEQNIMLLNQARVHALEDLDKILCEKGDLQGQINILETRLAETDARLKVAAQEKVYVEILENRLQKFKSELYESDVTDGCKYERFENSNMIPNEGASLSLSTSFMSLRDQLSLLREESMSFKEDIHTLKDELAQVKETDNSRVLSLEKELSLFQSSLKEVQYTLAVAQKDVSELSALKLECRTLWQKVENLQELYEKASTQADQSISVLPQNHELWKKVDRLENLLEEARSHEFLSEKAQQYNDLLQQKILSLEERLETSYKEIQTHVQLYQESVQEFQDTLYSLKKGSGGNLSTELLDENHEMPWDFWSRILLNLDGWLLEKKMSSNDAKLLREMTWKREGRIRDAYLSCKEKSESEAISTFLKLTSSRTSPGLHVIHIAAEMAPVAKVGGLGDVVCGLSKALQKKGHLVEVVLPKYDCMQCERIGDLKALDVVIESYFDGQLFKNKIWTGTIEGIPVYFIEPLHPARFFNRGNFYGEQDDFKRFSFFSRAALELLLQAGKKPDIIHCHEWQTAFIGPLYWDLYAPRGLNSARICFTCHNFEYQGKAPASELRACGLDVHQLNRPDRMQDNFEHDKVNPVKGAVVFANIVTTVSPTYAQEVLAPEGGQGLQGTLNYHSKKFVGVLNGIDTEAWNPSTDSFLRFQYSAEDLQGKMENKDMVRKHLKLSYADATRPLVGCITRLVPQKGVHLIRHAIYRTLELGGQFVLLGSSPVPHIQREFEGIAKDFQNHPHIRLILKYDEALSHCIYAATDMFIIPSIFEPCGLTQMIAMRYGSIPIARKTGGLNDSVFDIDDGTIPVQFRNGFTFLTANEKGLNNALERAFNCYNKNRENWQQLVRNNMKIDFSWDSSSAQYEELYEKSIARGRAAAATRQ